MPCEANWQNRTLFHGDNLTFLRAMNSGSVDLIATDPPFNKGRDFHATPDSLAAGARFQDRWSWERDVHESWADQITDDYPKLMEAIESARYAHSDGMGAYMCFMAVRLLEMRRVLKPTGSIYLHCDPTASHYLKAVMDAIFGWKQFRNEIIWHYQTGGAGKQQFSKKHDVILFFSQSDAFNFYPDSIRMPRTEKALTRAKNPKGARISASNKTKLPMDVWIDIQALNPVASERAGYPTQKPLALYERIIKASSNPNDIVLDPFAGCATTLVAAEHLQRQWVGMDIWEGAHRLVESRLQDTTGLFGKVTFTDAPSIRTDDAEAAAPLMPTVERRSLPTEPWQRMSRRAMFDALAKAQSITPGLCLCAGCGRELEAPFMELDHMTPRADRGVNDISNRILLCRPCNGRKNANLTMRGLIRENKKTGWMLDEARASHARELAAACYEEIRFAPSQKETDDEQETDFR